jgi:hypothetical protein
MLLIVSSAGIGLEPSSPQGQNRGIEVCVKQPASGVMTIRAQYPRVSQLRFARAACPVMFGFH